MPSFLAWSPLIFGFDFFGGGAASAMITQMHDVWCENSAKTISRDLRGCYICQLKVTEAGPESPTLLEVTGSSLSETLNKEESAEMPVEKNEAEDTTEADQSDNHQEETKISNELEVREGDQDEDKVMRHMDENSEVITNEKQTQHNVCLFHWDAKMIKLHRFSLICPASCWSFKTEPEQSEAIRLTPNQDGDDLKAEKTKDLHKEWSAHPPPHMEKVILLKYRTSPVDVGLHSLIEDAEKDAGQY